MKAIVLAAGKGSRISAYIDAKPKSTLTVNGQPIIRTTAELLLSMDMEPIVCVGYQYQAIEKALEGIRTRYYYNPFYSVTNNIASLWFAREEFVDTDVLILSADVVFKPELLKRIACADACLAIAADKSRVADGDYFFQLDGDDGIVAYGAALEEAQRDCVNVGIGRVGKAVSRDFKSELETLVETENYGIYFEQAMFRFAEKQGTTVKAIDMGGMDWREIDYYNDYEKAIKEF